MFLFGHIKHEVTFVCKLLLGGKEVEYTCISYLKQFYIETFWNWFNNIFSNTLFKVYNCDPYDEIIFVNML